MQFAHQTERRLIQKIYGRIAPRVMVTMTIHSLSLQQETHKAAHRQTCSIRSSQMTGKPEQTKFTTTRSRSPLGRHVVLLTVAHARSPLRAFLASCRGSDDH